MAVFSVNREWTTREDELLRAAVAKYGAKNWNLVASLLPAKNAFQCRLRYEALFSPQVNRAPFSAEEDGVLMRLAAEFPGQWATIGQQLGRNQERCFQRYNEILRGVPEITGGYDVARPGEAPAASATIPLSGRSKRGRRVVQTVLKDISIGLSAGAGRDGSGGGEGPGRPGAPPMEPGGAVPTAPERNSFKPRGQAGRNPLRARIRRGRKPDQKRAEWVESGELEAYAVWNYVPVLPAPLGERLARRVCTLIGDGPGRADVLSDVLEAETATTVDPSADGPGAAGETGKSAFWAQIARIGLLHELSEKIDELERANDRLSALLRATGIGAEAQGDGPRDPGEGRTSSRPPSSAPPEPPPGTAAQNEIALG